MPTAIDDVARQVEELERRMYRLELWRDRFNGSGSPVGNAASTWQMLLLSVIVALGASGLLMVLTR